MISTKGAKTKVLLYQSALSLFKARGYCNVSVEEIALQAGVAKATFYAYYDSKIQIAVEMINEYNEYYWDYFDHLGVAVSADKKIRKILREVFRFAEEKVGIEIVFGLYQFRVSCKPENLFSLKLCDLLYRSLVALIDEGQRTGIFRREAVPEALASFAMQGIRGVIYGWSCHPTATSLIEAGRAYESCFLMLLQTESAI
ncbi:MAG: TetR/AcrR family transcriptional regulator [Pygmaiobacter sp.]